MKYQHYITEVLAKHPAYKAPSRIKDINSLVDKVIFSEDGNKLGHISEVMIDMATGKISYAVMDILQDQQSDDRLFAIPWDALVYDLEKDKFVLTVTSSRFQLAPHFKSQDWPDMADERWADTVHSFYGTFLKRSSNIHSAM